MMSLTPPLPPSVPSDAAILGAMALLAALGNAANSQATLHTMATAKREIDQAISANNAALREATEAQAALSDLEARAQDVASREERWLRRKPNFRLRVLRSRSESED